MPESRGLESAVIPLTLSENNRKSQVSRSPPNSHNMTNLPTYQFQSVAVHFDLCDL
jgi:hypothetical protein